MGAHRYMCRCMYVGVCIGACNVGVNRYVQVYSVIHAGVHRCTLGLYRYMCRGARCLCSDSTPTPLLHW